MRKISVPTAVDAYKKALEIEDLFKRQHVTPRYLCRLLISVIATREYSTT